MHFTSGLPSMPLSDLQLHHHGNTYTVTGLVQYQEGIDVPNHFMAWLRNPDGKKGSDLSFPEFFPLKFLDDSFM